MAAKTVLILAFLALIIIGAAFATIRKAGYPDPLTQLGNQFAYLGASGQAALSAAGSPHIRVGG